MKTKIYDRWIVKTTRNDSVSIVRLDSGAFEIRTVTGAGDVVVETFTMSELAQIGLRAQ